MHPLHDSVHASAGTMKSENHAQRFRNRHFQVRTFLIYLLILAFVITPMRLALAQEAATIVGAPNEQAPIHPLVQQADASENYIVINGDGFAPAQITIEVGESVTWHNATGVAQPLYQDAPPDDLPETPSTAEIFLPLIRSSNSQASQQHSSADSLPAQENAPITTVAAGANFSLRFEQVGANDFYLGSDSTQAGQIIVQERSPTALTSVSPANGAGDVAVTRETVLEFSHPLDASSITADSIFAQFGGETLAATRHLSPDGAKLTLFYDAPLPASARVRVTVDGDLLRDATGQAVDANGDGVAGGMAAIDFDTLGIRMIPGTSVCGHVFASELGADASGGAQDVPLTSATITVDGMEATLRAVTDGSGAFCLDPAPAGRFFVHIDGRTASANVPAGAYYPFVGKAWEARSGAQTDIGNVYLPLVQPGTLQPVSQSAETMIHMAPSVLAERPEFADVAIKVPPDSLFANDGARGGQVGIAPVPPDRLPGTLSPFLNFPLVITVQTDGATNFDTPAPVCFPNLPAPDSGELLPAGAKSALMSFNHDAGRWEVIGPMTVSDGGALVCTDPGVGILAPGWHGTQQGAPINGGPIGPDTDECDGGSGTSTCEQRPDWNPKEHFNGCGPDNWPFGLGDLVIPDNPMQFLHPTQGWPGCGVGGGIGIPSFYEACKQHDIGYSTCNRPKNQTDEQFLQDMLVACSCYPANSELYTNCFNVARLYGFGVADSGGSAYRDAQAKACICTGCEMNVSSRSSGWLHPITNLASENQAGIAGTQNGDQMLGTARLSTVTLAAKPTMGRYYYVIMDQERSEIVQRGQAGSNGIALPEEVLLRPQTSYVMMLLNAHSLYEATQSLKTGLNGERYALDAFIMKETASWDIDADGLHDNGEVIIGTNVFEPDTDGDGIPDGTEVIQGTDPLDGLLVESGIIASTDTPGTALDVCVSDDLIVVADGEAGLALFDAPSGQNPTLLAQVDTPGNAQRVICPNANDGGSGNLVAVADGTSGLAIVDVTDPPAARVLHQVDPGRPAGVDTVTALVRQGDVVYVGTDNAQIAAVDLIGGHVLLRGGGAGPVRDLAIQGDHLFVLTAKALDVLALPSLQRLSTTASPGTSTGRRLALAGEVAYVVRGSGYNTFDLTDPAQPLLIASGETSQFGWKGIALNGAGLGVAAVGPNSTYDAADHISLYAVGDPAQTDQFLTTIETPGVAYAVAIYDGLAYVADGNAGLQIINYQAYDAQGQPPTVTLTTSAAGNQVEAGQWLDITASAADDVQARAVTFLVNGELMAIDRAFPFTRRMAAPAGEAGSNFTVQAQAVDTGGNVGESPPFTLTLVADTTPPQVLVSAPADGSEAALGTTSSLLVLFDEPLDSSTITADALKLFAAGSDGQIDTADDAPISGTIAHHAAMNGVQMRLDAPLSIGEYRVEIDTGVQNQSGLGLAASYSWRFSVSPKVEVFWTNPSGGDWGNGNNWRTGSPPAAIDDVYITMPGDYEVKTAVDFAVGALIVGAGSGSQILDLTNRTVTVKSHVVLQPSGHFRTSNSVITGTATLRNESIFNLRESSLMLPVDNVGEFRLWDQPTLLRGPIHNQEEGTILVISTIGSNQRVNAHIEGDLYNDGLLEIQPASTAFSARNATLTISGTLENRATGLLRGALPPNFINRGIGILNGYIVNRGRMEALGTLRIGGALLDNQSTGLLRGSGLFDIRSNTVEHRGTISPGAPDDPIAKLTVRDSLPMTTSTVLTVDISGLTAGAEHDQLVVEGDATLAGVLNIQSADGFDPQLGAQVKIITFNSRVGTFTQVNGLSLGNGKRWQVNYNVGDITLEVVAE